MPPGVRASTGRREGFCRTRPGFPLSIDAAVAVLFLTGVRHHRRRAWALGVAVGAILWQGIAAGQFAPDNFHPERFPAAWRHPLFVQLAPLTRFNRVDGVVQSVMVRGRLPLRFARPPLLEARARFDMQATGEARYRRRGGMLGLGTNLPLTPLGRLSGVWASLSVAYRKETASPDDWIVGRAENTLAALLTRHDYKNYYDREGLAAQATVRFVPASQVFNFAAQLAWRDDLHRSLAVVTDWSLLPSREVFRTNIAAEQGRERALRLTVSFLRQDTPRLPNRAITILGIYEKAGGTLGGDFDFESVFAVVHLQSRTWGGQRVTLRAVAGGRTGKPAPQHLLRLGGIGTLRGIPHQVLSGNRLWMLNAEYHLGGDLLGRATFPPFSWGCVRRVVPFLDLGVSYDLGTAYLRHASDQVLSGWFAGGAIDNWGLFLSVMNDLVRIEWATTGLLGGEYGYIWRVRTGWEL